MPGFSDQTGMIGLSVQAEIAGLEKIDTTFMQGLETIVELQRTVRTFAHKLQAQAVANVSGIAVTYSGGTFVINRQTGKLARSIQVVPGGGSGNGSGRLTASVVASASYASAVEGGSQARDMKPYLMGKTIPLPFKGSSRMNDAVVTFGLGKETQRKSSTGRKAGKSTTVFVKVGPQSRGWIIPAQPARPFMQAAGETIMPEFQAAIAEAFARHLNDA